MQKFTRQSILTGIALVVILGLGSWLRVHNTFDVKNVDEPNITKRAALVADGQWHIRWYNWPAQSLIRLDAIPYAVTRVVLNTTTNTQQSTEYWYNKKTTLFLGIGHLRSAFFGVLSLLLLFWIGRRVRNTATGLLAAAILSVSYLHTLHSHYATPDVPLTAGLLGCIAVGILIAQIPTQASRRHIWGLYALGGVLAGFCVATKYTGGLAIVPLLLGHAARYPSLDGTAGARLWQLLRILLIPLLTGLLVHTIFNPYFFADWTMVRDALLFESQGNRIGVDWSGQDNVFWLNFTYYLKGLLVWNGTGIAVIAYLTTCIAIIRYKHVPRELLGIIFFAGFMLLGLSSLQLHWSRWGLPFTPLVALLAAVGLQTSWQFVLRRLQRPVVTHCIAVIVLIIVLLPQTIVSMTKNNSFVAESVPQQMSAFVQQELPSPTKIFADTYYVTGKKKQQLSDKKIYLYDQTVAELKAAGVEYVIVKPNRYRFALKQPELYPHIITFFEDLAATGTLLHRVGGECSTVLGGKRDYAVYEWLATHSLYDTLFPCKMGTVLELYALER